MRFINWTEVYSLVNLISEHIANDKLMYYNFY